MERHRFTYESASVELVEQEAGHYYLHTLWANMTGFGHGSELMRRVCLWADNNHHIIALSVQCFGPIDRPDNAALEAFYERYGFLRMQDSVRPPYRLIRFPSRKIQAP